jgi:hypothetical protein
MKSEDILKRLAPCGLDCGKCAGYADGEISEHSLKLQQLLGNFERYAAKFSRFLPVFENYPQFREMLQHFCQASCAGCRNGSGANPNCGVIACYRGKGVDFCFQCDEFPCDKTGFDPDLRERWIRMNTRMREVGIEEYFRETRDLPRYV